MFDNTPNQPPKFRTKRWVEINDESRETYDVHNDIRIKISMIMSRLCDYSDDITYTRGITYTISHNYVKNQNRPIRFFTPRKNIDFSYYNVHYISF